MITLDDAPPGHAEFDIREHAGRVAVEQGATLGWDRYIGWGGAVIGMHTFGASAPAGDLLKKFGFTPEKVLEAARAQAKRREGN